MGTARRLHYSYEQYLHALHDSDLKLEFCDGVIYAMAGGTPGHGALGAAMIALLRAALLGRCTVFTSDVKVRVEATGLSTFPDISVVCGQQQTSPIDANSIVNPVMLVEVTSRSTEDYDRGDKLSHYKQLPSLRAVLFVSHRRQQVTVVYRVAGGWEEREFRSGENLTLSEPAVSLPVNDIYVGITLEAE